MRDEEWVVQFKSGETKTDPERNWVSKVDNELIKRPQTRTTESKRWKNESIYRIPRSMKEFCRSAYQPQTVSIGPYHYGEQQLEVMEEHKQRALLTFLERSKKPLQCYMKALAPEAEDLKNVYNQLEPKWKQDNEAFLQLMIVDGCFILEIMRIATAETGALSQMGYADNDPVFSNHGKLCFVSYLRRDMLKLENQLPLSVLIKLLLVEDGSPAGEKLDQLTSLVLKFFSQPCNEGSFGEYRSSLHILDLYRKSLLMRIRFWRKEASVCDCLPSRRKEGDYIISATKLIESGIDFKRSGTSNLDDISFIGGVLELPLVNVDDALESNYLNMMAFERFHLDAGFEVRSYVFFMHAIINSAGDARLLQSCGIIKNGLGNDKVVASLFNSLSRGVAVDPKSGLGNVRKKLSGYCQRPVLRWMAYAKRNYFTNPWVGLSVVATIFLFALAGVQTVYTVLKYHKPRKGN